MPGCLYQTDVPGTDPIFISKFLISDIWLISTI